jgi:membrane-associated protease RseP (regulator of RpoE activity)
VKLVPLLLSMAFAFPIALLPAADEQPKPPRPTVVTPAAKPFLGVNVDDNSASLDPNGGLPVTVVIPGSTAATLGLQAGDHLMSFNGQPLKAQADLARALSTVKIGDPVTIELNRKQGDKTEKKTVSGAIQERPQVRTLNNDLAKLRDEVLQLRVQAEDKKKKDISLVEVLQQLKELEQNLPAAIADFKKQYPKGEFNISIKIDITSDKTAKQPLEIGNQPGADVNASDGGEARDKPAAPQPPAPAPKPAPKP